MDLISIPNETNMLLRIQPIFYNTLKNEVDGRTEIFHDLW